MIATNYWIFQWKISFRSSQRYEALFGWKIKKTMYPSLLPSHHTSVIKVGIIKSHKSHKTGIKVIKVLPKFIKLKKILNLLF